MARRTCALTAQAFLIEHNANAVEFMGNRTECALLMLLRAWGLRYEAVRHEHRAKVFQVYNFSSERKMGSVLLRQGDGGALRLYNKVWSVQLLRSACCMASYAECLVQRNNGPATQAGLILLFAAQKGR